MTYIYKYEYLLNRVYITDCDESRVRTAREKKMHKDKTTKNIG